MDSSPFNFEDDPDPTIETEPLGLLDRTAVVDVREVPSGSREPLQGGSPNRPGWFTGGSRSGSQWPAGVDRVNHLVAIGARRARARVNHWRTTHGDTAKLESLQERYPEEPHRYEQLQRQIAWDLMKRKWIVRGVLFVGLPLALFKLLGALSVLGGILALWLITLVLLGWFAWLGTRGEWTAPVVHDGGPLDREVVHEGGSPGQPVNQSDWTGEPGEPLHHWADQLQQGLRAYGLIDKKDEIQATRPVAMKVGTAENGVSFTVTLPLTCPASKAIGKLHEMATVFDTTDDKLILMPAGGSNRLLWVWKCDRHPLSGAGTWSPLQDAPEVNVWKGWQFGWTITGEVVMVSPVGDRMLLGGSPGAGKSATAGLIPLGYALDPHAQSILMDPEGMEAWAPYRAVAEVIEGGDPVSLRRMADKLAWVVNVEIPRRQAEVQRVRREVPSLLDTDAINEAASRDRRYNLPALLIEIDEAASLFNAADKYTRETAEWAVGEIARRCRKYAITLVLITQKATADAIPSAISAMATSQYLLACLTDPMATAIIPDWKELGMNPRKALQVDDGRGGGTPGGGYFKGRALVEPKGVPWVLMRTDYVTSANVRAMIDRARALRQAVRPELLPSESDDTPPTPASPVIADEAPQSAAQPVVNANDEVGWETLMRCIDVIEPNGVLPATAVMTELVRLWPLDYAGLDLTRKALDELLSGTGVACKQVPNSSGQKPYSLRFQDVARALRDAGRWGEVMRRHSENTLGDSGPETGPDQGVSPTLSDSEPDTLDGGFS